MCLSIALERPGDVEESGTLFGFEYHVVVNRLFGFRCGYVKVSPGHPWHGGDFGDNEPEVHGGVTFTAKDTPCGKGEDDGYWLGFDCGHAGDTFDIDLMEPRSRMLRIQDADLFPSLPGDHMWTKRDVVAECAVLALQAQAVMP